MPEFVSGDKTTASPRLQKTVISINSSKAGSSSLVMTSLLVAKSAISYRNVRFCKKYANTVDDNEDSDIWDFCYYS